MLVAPSPIVTEVNLEQLEKADLPMLVTLLGIVTENIPQSTKAPHSMLVTLLGIIT